MRDGQRGPPRRLVRPLALAGLVVLAALTLWLVPSLQVEPLRERLRTDVEPNLTTTDRIVLDKDVFEAENAARTTLALVLSGVGVLVGIGLFWRSFEASRQRPADQRFAAAVEQLASQRIDGSPRTESRLGAVYALERLAAESPSDYRPVMDVLTAYVRENAAWRGEAAPIGVEVRPAAEVQAILTVLARRQEPEGSATAERVLDLRETDLRGADLSHARLDDVLLQRAHLEQAKLDGAALQRTNLREASLRGASLSGADLSGAALSRADLEGARLNSANLTSANLSAANLQGADLWQATLRGCNLRDADLRGADLTQSVLEQAILWRADLQDAVLSGAHVREAHLERANLLRVSGLTWEQLEGAFADEGTVWPLELMREKALEAIVPPEPLPRRRTVVRPAVRREAPTPMPPIPESLPRVSDVVERQGPNGAERQGADGANGRVRPSQPRRARAPEAAADRSQASEAGQGQVADGLPPSGEPGAALPETAPKTTLRVSDTTGTPKASPRGSDTAGSPRRARAPRSEARKGASSVRRTRWEPEPE